MVGTGECGCRPVRRPCGCLAQGGLPRRVTQTSLRLEGLSPPSTSRQGCPRPRSASSSPIGYLLPVSVTQNSTHLIGHSTNGNQKDPQETSEPNIQQFLGPRRVGAGCWPLVPGARRAQRCQPRPLSGSHSQVGGGCERPPRHPLATLPSAGGGRGMSRRAR